MVGIYVLELSGAALLALRGWVEDSVMSPDIAVASKNLSKSYNIYDKPHKRLLQMLLRNRRQFYRKFWALQGISFEIPRGSAFGIIGRNGSGKSTLLQVICGTLAPTTGEIRTNGRVAALLELGTGFNPEFTGRENVYMNAILLGLSKEQIDQRFERIASFADIGDFIEQPVKTYSSGMYMRLAFAVAANVDAEILVIDEALAVGDALFTQKCMRFLREFKTKGTLLFVSHDAAAVIGLCDSALWLHNGEVKEIGPAKEVSERYQAFLNERDLSGVSRPSANPPVKALKKPVVVTEDPKRDNSAMKSRDEMAVFKFQPGVSEEFGLRGAEIHDVMLLGPQGEAISLVYGRELVTLRVKVKAALAIESPIIGFHFKDRLGQFLFGDNTYLSHRFHNLAAPPGGSIVAEFRFMMPTLPVGDYSIAVAVASGTQEQHVQHHWVHDALVVKSLSSSVCTGLVGIPMEEISLSTE